MEQFGKRLVDKFLQRGYLLVESTLYPLLCRLYMCFCGYLDRSGFLGWGLSQ